MLAVLLLSPPALADVGHLPTVTNLHIHFAGEDRLPMQPMVPTRFVLPDAAGPEGCASQSQWIAAFTQVPVGDTVTWTSGLGSTPELYEGPPRLAWYVETVVPGSSDPLPAPLPPMTLHAQLRTGDAPGAEGRLLAQGTTTEAPSSVAAGDRSVYKYDLALSWVNRTLNAPEGLHLVITLDTDIEECRAAPLGLRAYADSENRPHLRIGVYDPVRIERLEAVLHNDTWQFIWHASNPWGRFDLAEPEPPTVLGPAGEAAAPTLLASGDGARLETVWGWDPAGGPNGTYRVEVSLDNAAGSATATASALFQVGSEEDPPPATDTPRAKQSPFGAWWLALVALALVRRRGP